MILAEMKKIVYLKICVTSLVICFSLPASITCQVEENVIKTVFFQRFADFTTWPASSKIQDKSSPFVIGLLAKSNFSNMIEKTYSEKTIYNKHVKIKYLNNISEAEQCHMIYIPKLCSHEVEDLLAFTKDKPILSIGDTKGYGQMGVHINLYTLEDGIRFEINETAVKKSGLHISHLLLDFATIVTYQENK